ncbi:YwqG family protein [Candidatus Enterococcus clewellii]|uniref:DUF1963 domain-containing protein n=1 Tax=Candidatus Enterococcus clewellii TaxID=1834193 RepID=A0A242KBD9_9ENTE|nr:YwqG family protein [Enterococcus sp. 9E7_DIV0242]OTP18483.1 hypothetical protein A5888_000297 [Enterococcus sp. 9E7_DIV0242]
MEEKLRELLPAEWLERFIETKTECLKLSFSNEGELALETSKAGGFGYLPIDQEYPRHAENGVPLFLLAQLNFSELPSLPNYPKTGLLAFYVDYVDDLIGLDFDAPTKQNGFRVLFFEDTSAASYTREQQQAIQAEINEELYKVVEGEFKLTGVKETHYVGSDSYEFKQYFGKTMYEWLDNISDDDEQREKVYNELSDSAAGSKLGGYPYFTQEDPRIYEETTNYDTLLFQLDTEKVGNDWPIMWGDMGVGNFFINLEALKSKEFTDVQYNWDCG